MVALVDGQKFPRRVSGRPEGPEVGVAKNEQQAQDWEAMKKIVLAEYVDAGLSSAALPSTQINWLYRKLVEARTELARLKEVL